VVAVQCSHNADTREHRRTAELDHQYQRLDSGLPFWQGGFFRRQRCDVVGRVAKDDELSARVSIPFDFDALRMMAISMITATMTIRSTGMISAPYKASYLVRWASIASQASSASARVSKGGPPIRTAGLLRWTGRQETTKPGCP
jgi:hypothetical protein